MLCDRYAPLVSAFAEPPYLLTEIGKHLARLKAAIPFRIPPDSKIRPQDRKVVLARDELNARAGEAVVEAPSRPSIRSLLPRVAAFGASPPYALLRSAHVVVRGLSPVPLAVPLLNDSHASVALAPLIERLEPLGAHARAGEATSRSSCTRPGTTRARSTGRAPAARRAAPRRTCCTRRGVPRTPRTPRRTRRTGRRAYRPCARRSAC